MNKQHTSETVAVDTWAMGFNYDAYVYACDVIGVTPLDQSKWQAVQDQQTHEFDQWAADSLSQ